MDVAQIIFRNIHLGIKGCLGRNLRGRITQLTYPEAAAGGLFHIRSASTVVIAASVPGAPGSRGKLTRPLGSDRTTSLATCQLQSCKLASRLSAHDNLKLQPAAYHFATRQLRCLQLQAGCPHLLCGSNSATRTTSKLQPACSQLACNLLRHPLQPR